MTTASGSIDQSDPASAPARRSVEEQLEKIANSAQFAASKRLAAFLRFITHQALDGDADAITQSTIAAAVYERDTSFNPSADPLVRVEANRLRKALAKYYAGAGLEDSLVIAVPLRSYIPTFATTVQASGELPLQMPTPLASPASEWQLPTLGILPFNSLGNGPDRDQLMFEEILSTDLSQFPTVRVLPFTDNIVENRPSDNLTLARELGMDFAITGTIRASSHEVRIEIALLDVAAPETIWSERFETGASERELFDFPYTVSRRTSALVADAYGAILRRMSARMREPGPPESALYEAVLRFFETQQTLNAEQIQQCLETLNKAAPLSQHSAEYFALLGYCLADTTLFQRERDNDETREAALHHVRHAVAMEPTSALVQNARALTAMLEGNTHAVADASHQMVQCLPNSAYILGAAGFFLATIGEYDHALERYQQSIELNSRHPAWFHLTPCFYHFNRGEFELALKSAGLIGLNDFFWEQLLKASLLGYLGRYDLAQLEGEKLLNQIPDFTERSEQVIGVYTLHAPLARRIHRGLELAEVLPNNT